jgi:putative transposase
MEPRHEQLSIARQCELLDLPRSSFYYEPLAPGWETQENLELMRLLDRQYTQTPFYGSRRMTAWLRREGYRVNRKRVSRLMAALGVEAIYPRPSTSQPDFAHRIYPYLLRNVTIERVNQVWSIDITYIRLRGGFVYLVAILDWFSRYVLSWELSNSLEGAFCVAALERALSRDCPEIFNSDQGCQFTSADFIARLKAAQVRISMDGRGRFLDNIWVERLWRTVKYEEVYLKDYKSAQEARDHLERYLSFYNKERLHQSLDYKTPHEVYCAT